tara:strand:- start:353 stop:628 length:276 start_codon:yes stop_codon:yes gene_type:complete
MARRGSSTKELKEKRNKLTLKVDSGAAVGRTKNAKVKTVEKKKKTSKLTGKERAQQMAKDRIAAKKAGTYKAPKTAQQLAKERIAARKKKK